MHIPFYCSKNWTSNDTTTYPELSAEQISWLQGITATTALWVFLNIITMCYLFFHYMIKLRIFGKLIL